MWLALFRTYRRRELWLYVAVAILTIIVTVFALHLWEMTLSVPLSYQADALQVEGQIDAVNRTGWYQHQPLLGAPFGQVYHDFPQGGVSQYALIWVVLKLAGSTGAGMNIYYLLGYPLAALTCAWFLRTIGVNRLITVALAVLFAIAPYHFFRGESHYLFGEYWSVPFFGIIVVRMLLGRPVWARTPGGWRSLWGYATLANAFTMIMLVLSVTSVQYFGVFDLLLLPVAGIIGAVRSGRFGTIWGHVATWAIAAIVFLVAMLPDLIYQWRAGPNFVAAFRPADQAEQFSLKVIMLLLPSFSHRDGPLYDLAQSYQSQFAPSTNTSLGIIGSLGFIALVIAAMVGIARVGTGRGRPARTQRADGRRGLLGGFAAMVLWILLLGSTGGLVIFISLLVTTEVRGWDRLSIYIALFCLGALGIVLTLGERSLRRALSRSGTKYTAKYRPTIAIALVALLILGIGGWDQTGPRIVPSYAFTMARYTEDTTYVAALEKALPAKASIFQLPYQPFPEGPYTVNNMTDYDHLRLTFYSKDFSWSYGGVKGRPASDWPSLLTGLSTAQQLDDVASANFTGISIDRDGYADHGKALEAELATLLGVTPIVSSGGTYSYWDLTALRSGLIASEGLAKVQDLGYRTTHPVLAYGATPGLSPLTVDPSRKGQFWQASRATTRVDVATNSAAGVPVSVSFYLGEISSIASFTITGPGSTPQVVHVGSRGGSVRLDFTAEPSHNFITIAAVPAGVTYRYDVDGLEVVR